MQKIQELKELTHVHTQYTIDVRHEMQKIQELKELTHVQYIIDVRHAKYQLGVD